MRRLAKFIRTKLVKKRRIISISTIGLLSLFIIFIVSDYTSVTSSLSLQLYDDYRRRPECTCSRPVLFPPTSSAIVEQNENRSSLCSRYATQRGPNQRIISISLFGPQESDYFVLNQTLHFLDLLIKDLNTIYSDGFVLRIYHDQTINAPDVICPIECEHPNVDFCDTTHKLYIPPKIWRFIPAGDPLVDIMMSRDLDSAFTARERAVVDLWLASNKSFHAMRDNPYHNTPMLGGLWGFRPSHRPDISRIIYDKIHNESLVRHYRNRADQRFLAIHVWPLAKSSLIVHDSFLCDRYGHRAEPYPTQRPPANETNCYVGCVRPCCGSNKMPFGECPMKCRPKDHPEWIYC